MWTLVARDTAFMDRPLASQWAFQPLTDFQRKASFVGGFVDQRPFGPGPVRGEVVAGAGLQTSAG